MLLSLQPKLRGRYFAGVAYLTAVLYFYNAWYRPAWLVCVYVICMNTVRHVFLAWKAQSGRLSFYFVGRQGGMSSSYILLFECNFLCVVMLPCHFILQFKWSRRICCREDIPLQLVGHAAFIASLSAKCECLNRWKEKHKDIIVVHIDPSQQTNQLTVWHFHST